MNLLRSIIARTTLICFRYSPIGIKTEQEKANRLHKVITKVNKRLKQIGEELGIPIPITTYVARHSQATIMKKAGISTAIIGQIMGHSSERVTQVYLDSFDNEQIGNAIEEFTLKPLQCE